MVVIVRCVFVYLCSLEYFFGFAVFIVFFGGNIFQVVDSFCFVWFRTAYPGEVSCFLTVIAFYGFSRAVVLVCPVLLSTKSTVVFLLFLLFSELFCLDFLDRFLFYLFVLRQCRWYGRLFVSAVVADLCDKFYGGFRVKSCFADQFSRSFLSVMLVINFDMSRSSCLMSLNSHVLSNVISFFQCSSGVSFSSCLAQKKSPRLWYVFLLGM